MFVTDLDRAILGTAHA